MMNMIQLALSGAWSVLITSLVFGVGAPLVYATAMRMRVTGATVTVGADGETHVRPRLLGNVLATLLLLITVGIVALGIAMIAADGLGKTVKLEHIIPTFVDG